MIFSSFGSLSFLSGSTLRLLFLHLKLFYSLDFSLSSLLRCVCVFFFASFLVGIASFLFSVCLRIYNESVAALLSPTPCIIHTAHRFSIHFKCFRIHEYYPACLRASAILVKIVLLLLTLRKRYAISMVLLLYLHMIHSLFCAALRCAVYVIRSPCSCCCWCFY